MLFTFAASVFTVGVHSIGCALLAPHQTLTSVPEREVKKKINMTKTKKLMEIIQNEGGNL
jgi:hypothetical protein